MAAQIHSLETSALKQHGPVREKKRKNINNYRNIFLGIVLFCVFVILHCLSIETHQGYFKKPNWIAFGNTKSAKLLDNMNGDLTRNVAKEGNNRRVFNEIIAPRYSRYMPFATIPARRLEKQKPAVNVVVICHLSNSCCHSTLPRTLGALIRQSLMPDSLKIVHSCAGRPGHKLLIDAIHTAVADQHRNVAAHISVSEKYCASTAMPEAYDRCILTSLGADTKPEAAPLTLVLSDLDILEPTAVEKKWIYLTLRPSVPAVSSLSYDEASLFDALEKDDPLQIRTDVPSWNHGRARALSPLPLMYRVQHFKINDSWLHYAWKKEAAYEWKPFINMVSRGRLLREALYTYVQPNSDSEETTAARIKPLTFRYNELKSLAVPHHMLSDLAFYKWSARHEEDEIYAQDISKASSIDVSPMRKMAIEASPAGYRMFLIMPWMQMGGSEKAMLDLAETLLSMKWSVTFVFTMPDWKEDSLGELEPQNQWLDKVLSLTSDVFDIVRLTTFDQSTRAFRHLLESRSPDYVLLSNTPWAYAHTPLIKSLLPLSTIADYNHMLHMDWKGGGLPRFGANYSANIDIHFTASMDVATPMDSWISSENHPSNLPHKIKPCYIGTDPSLFHTGVARKTTRTRMRESFDIPQNTTVILFAGRFVFDKGLDVLIETVTQTSNSSSSSLFAPPLFLFVGDGPHRPDLERAQKTLNKSGSNATRNMLVLPPAVGISQLRDYYAMSDIFLLPSVNEGIALVLYEAMAANLLIITTDVGGQRELVTPSTGILLPPKDTVQSLTREIVSKLKSIMSNPAKYDRMRQTAFETIKTKFTTQHFCACIIKGLTETATYRTAKHPAHTTSIAGRLETLGRNLVHPMHLERRDGMFKRSKSIRSIDKAVTIIIKTYVCNKSTVEQVRLLLNSIRASYETVRVMLGNDGPMSLADEDFVLNDEHTEEVMMKQNSGISHGRNTLLKLTTTKYFVLLDDDHVMDAGTDIGMLMKAAEMDNFDIVGIRVRNLPGILELENTGIGIPRYVAQVLSLENRKLSLCIWNENNGPSVVNMTHAIQVDVVHNAFLGRVDGVRRSVWREELEVNEHMTFFLDAKKNGVRVGYLPSVFVHHRARVVSGCYSNVRYREEKFAKLLEYDESFEFSVECGKGFPDRVRKHMNQKELGKKKGGLK